MDDVGADLDALDAAEEARSSGQKPPVKPAAKPPEGEKPPDDGQAGKTGAKPGEKPPEAGAVEPPPEPKGLAGVRAAYDGLKKKVAEEFTPKIQQLEAKVKELETANPPEVKALQTRLEAAEKRRDELEQEIVYVNYAQSKEYKEQYEKPYFDAWADARADLAELTVETDGGQVRRATDDDLILLAQLPMGEARKKANAMFGDSADDVMAHRRKIIDLAKAQSKALEDAKTKSKERSSTTEADRRATAEKRSKLWTESNQAIVQKWPAVFGEVAEDKDGNALLAKSTAMVDKIYNPTAENKPANDEEAVRLHAVIYQKARNHDRLKLWLNRANAKVKELEKALADFEASAPNGGLGGRGGKTGAAPGSMEDANAELDALDKKA